MKVIQISLLSFLKTDPSTSWSLLVAAVVAVLVTASKHGVQPTLPTIPHGVSVLNTVGDKALKGILTEDYVDMISIEDDWNIIQLTSTTDQNWTYLDNTIGTITAAVKSVLLRIPTLGGASTLGARHRIGFLGQ